MKITRTANAGVLINLDGVNILLDGICGEIPPYLATPEEIKTEICSNLPDIAAFTHFHTDHSDKDFINFYESKTRKSIISPENRSVGKVGDVEIISVPTRHIGKSDIEHISFVIKGSQTIWFMGDAGPLILKSMSEYPKPDVLFAPFSHFNSSTSLRLVKEVEARKIVVLHLPNECDELGICETVLRNIKNEPNIYKINLGETITF